MKNYDSEYWKEGRFFSDFSHEIRTPLNAIIGFSQILDEGLCGALTNEQKEYIQTILKSGKRTLTLINDITDIYYIEIGKLELHRQTLLINKIIHENILLIQKDTVPHDITISTDIPHDAITVQADQKRLNQILMNLLYNAIRFTPNGGKIGIDIKTKNNNIEITLWDTGVGIKQEDNETVFKPFSQIDTPAAPRERGTGLRLALTKKLVEMHGGTIGVKSDGINKGCRFYFTLPVSS